jgi:hypothetical protein
VEYRRDPALRQPTRLTRNPAAGGEKGEDNEDHISCGNSRFERRRNITSKTATIAADRRYSSQVSLAVKLINDKMGGYKMSKVCLVAAIGLATLSLTATKSWAECSNLDLNGTYAFAVHGQSITVAADGSSFTSTGLIDGVGQISFDGNGTLTQHDYIVKNSTLVPGNALDKDGFHGGESGTYNVNGDCTGNAQIVLSPGGNTRSLEFVLADYGRTIHAIVSSSMVNGAPATLQVYSDFQKLDSNR